jgi:aminopeptidase N
MRKSILIFMAICLANTLSAQLFNNEMISKYNEIINHHKKMELYEAVKKEDAFISKYGEDPGMVFNRGMAKFYMRDVNGAIIDLLRAQRLGLSSKENVINSIANKNYMVKLLTDNYIDDNDKLNANNGYKLPYTLRDTLHGALRAERTCFDVKFYRLTVKILPRKKRIEGSNDIYFKTTEKTNKIQIDLASQYKINAINWKGKELKYTRNLDAIFIEFGEYLAADEDHVITIKYEGAPRIAPSPPWNGGFVWRKKKFKHWIGVACEHLGASSWWPCKDHLSDKPDSVSINIQVPNGYQGIANGNLRSKKEIDKKYTNFEWFVSYPINTYNVTFYMGKFINFNEKFTNALGTYSLDFYVLKHQLNKAKKYYNQTKDIVKSYEKLFGEYPYMRDGIAMVEAPYAGMEHQGAIAIGDEYGETKRRNYENSDYDYLLVHETAHEWWGNTITMGDMADAWLSEGFATYTEHLFIEDKLGYNAYLSAASKSMMEVVNIWPVVGNRNVNDNSFVGGDIYRKGAAILNNLRCTMNNDSAFFKLIKDFYNARKYKISKTSDFVDFVNNYTAYDYTDFFNKFLYETEPPILEYQYNLNAGILEFKYKWTKVGQQFKMPFALCLNDNEHIRIEGNTTEKTIKLENVKSFYIPNEYRFDKNKISKNSLTYFWTNWVR